MENQAKELMDMMDYEERQKCLREIHEAIEKEQLAEKLDYERLKRQEAEIKNLLDKNGIAETDIVSGIYALLEKRRQLMSA